MDGFEDDDFGDLYADVEVQASSAINAAVVVVQATSPELSSGDDGGGGDGKEVSGGDEGEGDGDEKEEDGDGEVGVVETGGDDYGSDSEDDLKIVLNSDDDDGGGGGGGTMGVSFPVVSRGVNMGGLMVEDEDEERDNGGGGGIAGSGLEGNGVNDKVENVGCGGGGGERANGGGKGGYHMQHSQYKYVRSHSAIAGNKAKENSCSAISSYSYLSSRADREDNGHGLRVGSGSAVAQSGNNFSLPRSRTILDVNIDIFERKPWSHPGADITDFFNFGFDEESWKRYCNLVDEYRHRAAIPTRAIPFESFKSTEAYEVDNETMAHEVVRETTQSRQGRAVPFGEQQSEMHKGRAIQVEDSSIERKPSMDVRRPLDRDSDVIHINVQDSRENSSGTAKEDFCHENRSLHEVSDNEDNVVDESGEFLSFSTASDDELNSESLDGFPEGVDVPVSKRSSQQTTDCPGSMDCGNGSHQISDLDRHHNRIVAARGSEGTDGGTGTENKTKERAGGETCATDPSIVEAKSSHREKSQNSRRSSCSVSPSEAIEDGSYIGTRKSYCHAKRPSTNSISEFRKSARSERSDIKRKPADSRYYERYRSPVHRNKRIHGVSESKGHFDYKDNVPVFDAEGLYDVRRPTVDHSRAKERLPAVDLYYEGRDLSYQKECELPFDFYGERFSDYEFRDDRTKGLHRKGFRGLGAEKDRFMFRNPREGGDFPEEDLSMMEEEMMAMDWYHYENRPEELGPLSNQELEQLNFEYSSYLEDERGVPWERKGDELHFRRRGKNDEIFRDRKYSNDLRHGKYRRSLTYHDRDRQFLEHNYDRNVQYSRREGRNCGRNKRRFGSPSVGLDNYWSAGDGDGFLRCRDDPSISSRSLKVPRSSSSSRRFHDPKMPRNSSCDRQGKDRREWSERYRDGVSFGGYYNDLDTEESINNIVDSGHLGRRRHHSKAERLLWNEGHSISRPCGDKFHAEGAQFSFPRISRRNKFDDLHESDHAGELIDDIHVNGGARYKPTREGDNGYQFDRTPKIIQSHEPMFLSCEDSIVSDLIVVEGKSSGRYHERHGKKDWNVGAEQKTRRDSDESVSQMVAQVDNPDVETNRNDEKWLDKFPVTQDNEALDIEEGQIIAEDNNEGVLDKICAPDEELPRSDTKEFRNQNGRNGKPVGEGNGNPRFLEVMAKMEKRRERFKEPISSRKDSDNSNLVGSVGGTSTARLQRPARKRRWGGR